MKPSEISPVVQTGFASAAAYDAYRPTYPGYAVEGFLRALKIAGVQGAKVADLAAGTGKFTEVLAARPEKFDIIAIEPHDGMREQLERKNLRGVRVVKGTAEDLSELPSGELAALVAAQSFHWFANTDALKQIHRVLRPTGIFGIIWLIEDYNAPKSWEMEEGWGKTVRELTWTFDDGIPRFRHQKWKQIFDDQIQTNPIALLLAEPLFSLPLGEANAPFEQWLSRDDLWKRYQTLSQIAILEGDELERVRRIFFEAMSAEPEDSQGRVAFRGRVYYAWTTQIPTVPLSSDT